MVDKKYQDRFGAGKKKDEYRITEGVIEEVENYP